MKILATPRLERCIGCHSCSLACARLVHERLSWDMAGVRITSSGGLSTGFEARTCLACNPAPCAAACPTGAYSQRRGGGVLYARSSASAAASAPGPARWTRFTGPDGGALRLSPLRQVRALLPP